MEPHYRVRLYLLTALILFGFGSLLTRLHSFQIERREYFQSQVPGSREVTVREPGIRGEITDRNGVALARNLRNYEVSFNLEEIYEAYLKQHDKAPRQDAFYIQDGMDRKRSEVNIVKIVNDWIIVRLVDLGLAKNYSAGALEAHYKTHGGLIPFTYRADLTYEEFAKFAEHNLELPGVYLSSRPQRDYPYGSLGSHVIGFVKQWEKGDIPDADKRKFSHYIGDERGEMGIEGTMDSYLRGVAGERTFLKDEKGNVTPTPIGKPPQMGAKVELAIDARIQLLAENTLRNNIGRGAAVVMDVNTGEVLAMASVPDYDLNAFIPSITAKRFADYKANESKPFSNRAISSFAPGSTFKIPTAVSGSLKGLANKSFSCSPGFIRFGNKDVGCWLYNKSKGNHGTLDLKKAIQQSCNPYFNKMAMAAGIQGMVDGFSLMGLGQRTGIELPNEDPGILPGSKEWRAKNPSLSMTNVDIAFVSIGQGYSMASPLQLCAMTACIANGGKYYKPRLVKKVVSGSGEVLVPDAPKLKVDLTEAGVKASDIELIRKGMWMAVNEAGGTAGRAKLPNIEIAAKTGTAQTSDMGKKSHNSWIVSFAPFEAPKYAVCVLVQNGGSGGGVCGPLANMIYRGLFVEDEGMKLGLRPQVEFGGNLNRYETENIKLPEDVLSAINATPADDGETGEEAGAEAASAAASQQPSNKNTPAPTITEEADEKGKIPKAKPVRRR
ncbi:MAG TPA: penicillin-binding protein 2 [Luteolibacter sp.]|nr:penicillin-binding protein 2 [Luteolibacter sp.]